MRACSTRASSSSPGTASTRHWRQGAGGRTGVLRACPTTSSSATRCRWAGTAGSRPGVEANGYAEGTETPPDLKESYSLGAETATGDPEVDRIWFAPNVWPAEVPSLQPLVNEYTAAMRRLADDLLALFAYALGLPQNPFASLASGRPGP